VGLAIPILDKTDLVKTEILLIAGLFELLIVLVYGVWYLRTVLQTENKGLLEQHSEMSTAVDKIRDQHRKFYENPSAAVLEANTREGDEIIKNLEGGSKKKNCGLRSGPSSYCLFFRYIANDLKLVSMG